MSTLLRLSGVGAFDVLLAGTGNDDGHMVLRCVEEDTAEKLFNCNLKVHRETSMLCLNSESC